MLGCEHGALGPNRTTQWDFLRKSNGDLTWNFYGDLLEFEIDELKTPKILGILVMINIVWYTH